ncbi:hypothetical protein BLNAU_4228 [Blattamonas nauphoetae]|uniref:Uncharacterized protein n=3 Tax=Blattamonas nauphoetae TaxID=2049346 RepID=A0ABQ9YAY9_9EUKA|nr:hypothetical protein BLNAU_16336 [Blattamonas nauphoetae]KAK2950687.1 hypothetical protein BLNAU_14358 [Blattamonas nauphoetae]KAK2951667.1 hypothetical protein BLNAU_13406 [Blattamonas nauphoetae]KAK2958611.1 hypothetical protein BLNAU_6380 [Blattamonas nauphoetae]KAK2960831.1 hypothetical protein BLNAU_4228 [Blattamonas nauphoetae]
MVVGYLENEKESVLRKLASDERSQKEMSERKMQIPSAEEAKINNRTRSENKETGEDVKLKSHFPTESGKTINLSSNNLSILADRHKIWHFYIHLSSSPLRLSPFPDFDMCGSMPGKRDNVCSSSTDHSACVSCLTGCIQQCVPEREDCLIQCESESISNKGTNTCLKACKQNAEKCLALSSSECIDECSHARSESQDVNQ